MLLIACFLLDAMRFQSLVDTTRFGLAHTPKASIRDQGNTLYEWRIRILAQSGHLVLR